ncbi:hypothetical protein [Bacillus sp. Marseille-P3800]|uniref:hypothetical protein n=1 Tax=Bacillus sp. Marseille-P3800 TaxID=2014782 RepID=UPI000C085301|nr:hypothetical protein [Bacillus sp. Marseille-P3800]
MRTIEDVINFYEFKIDTDKEILYVKTKGKFKEIEKSNALKSVFTFDLPDTVNKSNLSHYLSQGLVAKVKHIDLYAKLFNWSEEKIIEENERMRYDEYIKLKEIMKAASLESVNVDFNFMDFKDKTDYEIDYKFYCLGLYKNQWVVEELFSNGIDESWSKKFFFSEKPSEEKIKLAVKIDEVTGQLTSRYFYNDQGVMPYCEDDNFAKLKGTPNEILDQYLENQYEKNLVQR